MSSFVKAPKSLQIYAMVTLCLIDNPSQLDTDLNLDNVSWFFAMSRVLCPRGGGGRSGMRKYTCATRKTRKKGFCVFLKTDAFRGAKTQFFRN